jgi:predicted aspartyl protease
MQPLSLSTSFDRKSFGRRIVAKVNNNLNEPTISADRSWAFLNFGTSQKHCFLYDTGASVTLITPQTFEHARQNGKVGKKWQQHGISIKNASGGAMEITGLYTTYFTIDGRQMEAPFIVTREATSNILGMNVIRTYKLKMDVLTTRVYLGLFPCIAGRRIHKQLRTSRNPLAPITRFIFPSSKAERDRRLKNKENSWTEAVQSMKN